MMKHNITVPLPFALVFITAFITLLCSDIFNLSTTLKNVRLGVSSERTFPVLLRSAALKTVKAGRLGLYANSSDWESILPRGDGFFFHPEDGQHYLLAHYHNLHCIRSLRHYLHIAMVSNLDYEFTDMDKSHVDHCLIYLRQIALCNADVTLEPANHKQVTPAGTVAETVTGVGVVHRCVDWSQIWNYMEENFNKYKDTYHD